MTPPLPHLRPCTPADAEQIHAIYAPVVEETAISFEYTPPSIAEMRRRIAETIATHPWLVAEVSGRTVGYAYAHRHRERAAYQWTAETSVYISREVRRAGLGRVLYTGLLAQLQLMGFYNACAGITLPNPASVGLHEALGFRPVGVYPRLGWKFGGWHDVGWWIKRLRDDDSPEIRGRGPAPPLALSEAMAMAEWSENLRRAADPPAPADPAVSHFFKGA
jgi:phosphinothricin acetyltransferase